MKKDPIPGRTRRPGREERCDGSLCLRNALGECPWGSLGSLCLLWGVGREETFSGHQLSRRSNSPGRPERLRASATGFLQTGCKKKKWFLKIIERTFFIFVAIKAILYLFLGVSVNAWKSPPLYI